MPQDDAPVLPPSDDAMIAAEDLALARRFGELRSWRTLSIVSILLAVALAGLDAVTMVVPVLYVAGVALVALVFAALWWLDRDAADDALVHRLEVSAGPTLLPETAERSHRLGGRAERDRLAAALERLRGESSSRSVASRRTRRAPSLANRPEVQIELAELIALLRSEEPVTLRGMARARLLVTDMGSPLHRGPVDELEATLHHVIAALRMQA